MANLKLDLLEPMANLKLDLLEPVAHQQLVQDYRLNAHEHIADSHQQFFAFVCIHIRFLSWCAKKFTKF